MNPTQTRKLPRSDIASFIKEPRGQRAFEAMQQDIGSQYDALSTASFLVIGSEPSLGAERVLTPLAGDLTGTDAGANSTYTLGLAATTVVAGTYGGVAKSVALAIDAKGRITSAGEYNITTTLVPEGINLYYTDARARLALSGGTGISYNSITGAFTLANTAVAPASYGSATSIPSFTVDQQGRLTAASGNTIPTLAAGTYTPTITNISNVNVGTGNPCQYMRVGNTVTVSGSVNVSTTASGTTQVGISLPIASTFSQTYHCGGNGNNASVNQTAQIKANGAGYAHMTYTALGTGSVEMEFHMTYQIL